MRTVEPGKSAGQGTDLWVKDSAQGTPARLTFLKDTSDSPVWTPDGKSIIFRNAGGESSGMYWIRADGGGDLVRLTESKKNDVPYSISSDGKLLAFAAVGANGTRDLFTAPIDISGGRPKLGTASLFLGTLSGEAFPAFSPDGRWLAYMSNESGVFEIYVRPFPGPGGKWQLSSGGGSYPVWSRDGRELLFQNADQRVIAVKYTSHGDSFTIGERRTWSSVRTMSVGVMYTWDIAPDGKQLVMCLPATEEKQRPATHLMFVFHFADELQRRAAGR